MRLLTEGAMTKVIPNNEVSYRSCH